MVVKNRQFEQQQKVAQAGGHFHYLGSPDSVEEKVALYNQMDVFCVPTDYHEPKGLYLLEAMASGLPVVQPEHGAFPEILGKTKGGLLARSGNLDSLVTKLSQILNDVNQRHELATAGFENVRKYYSIEEMSRQTVQLFTESVQTPISEQSSSHAKSE